MGAYNDRLIQAAELLDMTPNDLLDRLDPPIFPTSLVGIARERQARILDRPRVDPEDARTLARCFRELDIHLSAGGELPAEWRRRSNAPDEDGRCPVWLGHAEDIGGENRCAGPASHPGRQHDTRPGTWQR